jgi:predicted nucleic acid-binding protein
MAFAPATPETLLVLDNDLFTHLRNSLEYVKNGVNRYFSHHHRLPALPSIVVFEALRGFQRDERGQIDAKLAERHERLQVLVRNTEILPFDLGAAEFAGLIWAALSGKQQRQLIDDVLIAATALAHGFGVATGNRRDFEAIGAALPKNLGPLYIDVWK